jgi:hypothetical protein
MQVVKGDVENALCSKPHARRVVTVSNPASETTTEKPGIRRLWLLCL